jgi:hypothetical protein
MLTQLHVDPTFLNGCNDLKYCPLKAGPLGQHVDHTIAVQQMATGYPEIRRTWMLPTAVASGLCRDDPFAGLTSDTTAGSTKLDI